MNVEGRYLGRSPHELQNVLGQAKDHGLIPKRHALEVTERLDRDGNVVVALDEDDARAAIRRAARRRGARRSRCRCCGRSATRCTSGGSASSSREADPDVFVAAVVRGQPADPGVRPQRHHDHEHPDRPRPARLPVRLEAALRERGLAGPLLVMQSNGGAVAAAEAPATAISTVGSVLTGGVVGSVALGRQLGHRNIISTDVGGTTFLVGLVVDGEPVRATTTIINHHPINVPTLQVHAIGSGGGAIAWIDAGRQPADRPAQRAGRARARLLRAAAAPSRPTPTPTWCSASSPSGACSAAARRWPSSCARQAIDTQIAKPLGLSVEDAAAAIYAIQNAQTGDLLRKTVVEAGHDPRDFVLYAFGGAGPAHCARYAAEVGVTRGRRAARAGGLGVLRLRAGRLRHRAGRRAVRSRRRSRSTRRARSRTSPTSESAGPRRARPAGRAVRDRSSWTARSTCATRCSWPKSPRR